MANEPATRLIACPCCKDKISNYSYSCEFCGARLFYGQIPEEVIMAIWMSAALLGIFAMEIMPKAGAYRPFFGFIVTTGSVAILGYWRAKFCYRDKMTFRRSRQSDLYWPLITEENLQTTSLVALKLRQGFELHVRKTHGYKPLWDSVTNEYLVATTQDKWICWKSAFKNLKKEVLICAKPEQLLTIYSKTQGSSLQPMDIELDNCKDVVATN